MSTGSYGKIEVKFELGSYEICPYHVDYTFNPGTGDLISRMYSITGSFTFASQRMKEEVERYLPRPGMAMPHRGFTHVDIEKDPESILLRDILNFYKGEVPAVHVAWILSTMYNLYCYFNYIKIVHGDISLDSYFIVPKTHSCQLLGGWWYASRAGERISKVPKRTFDLLPYEVRVNKLSTPKIDGELIKACGRELLGQKMDCPEPMKKWLNSPSIGKAIEEYKLWGEVLTKSFGQRRFTEMNIKPETIYGKR